MAAPTKKFFTFRFPTDLKKFEGLDDKSICVISVIGKTHYNEDKTSIFNKVLDRDIFFEHASSQDLVRGCYDADKRVVILECVSGYDTAQLASLLSSAAAFDNGWNSVVYNKARVLLYALQVSHIVVCHCPGLSLDTSYIRLFRALDHTRNKLHLADELNKCGLPKSWCSAGRPTCPRMLFVFNPRNPALSGNDDSATLKKLTNSLEDQIYKILRKTRIITNNPNSALFAVPANQPFVHILTSEETPMSRDNLSRLFDVYLSGGDPQSIVSKSSSSGGSFKELLSQHIDLAHGAGFDDSIGRNSSAGLFHIGKLKSWFMMAARMYTLLVDSTEDSSVPQSTKLTSVYSYLKSTMEVEQRFSESRCQKVMQVAEKAYQESLPEHYTEGVHHTQLSKAQLVMKTSGRGAALHTYMERLNKECTAYWMNGHRLCESISLSGNHCIHQLHRLPNEPITDETDKLPCSEHSTSVSFTVACNCGRTLKNIGDPFTAKEANFSVYDAMAKDCCSSLTALPFPLYVAPPVSPSAHSPAPGTRPAVTAVASSPKPSTTLTTATEKSAEKTLEADTVNVETQRHSSNLSGKMASLSMTTVNKLKQDEEDLTTISDNQSYNNSLSQGMRPETTKTDASVTDENIEPISTDELVIDTVSSENRIGYLSHMLTNSSTKGLLPDYPSWSLTRLGSYSSYNPNTGLDQQGFVTASNFLLPWEVIIKGIVKDQSTWPHVGEPTTHKQRKKMAPKRHVVDTSAKIYLGDCYTCAQGHRFMCGAPDKITKVTSGTLSTKDNANKLLTMDMPLYTTCPKGENCVGQLRHIYICTPEIESLVVSILPKIQPAPVPCPLFLPSNEGPIKLPPNGLWVLRLPHFYVDEKGHYPLPDPQSMTSCRLLKGTFSFRNTSDPLL